MGGGTVYCLAALLGAFRRGNNPRFYRGKKNSLSMRLSEGKQMLKSKHVNEKEMLKELALPVPVYGWQCV